MKKRFYIPGVILALCVLLTVFLTCLESVAYGGMDFYRAEYEKYGICELMDMEMDDLLHVMEHTLEYMRGNKDELQVEAKVGGETVEFYNEREISHMADVRGLVINAFIFRAVLVCSALLCLLVIMALRPERLARLFAVSFLAGSLIFLAFVVIVGTAAAVDFTAFWSRFHGIFFTNDLWVLDPATDRMINICPEGLFNDIVRMIVVRFGVCIGAALVLSVVFTVVTGSKKSIEKRQKAGAKDNLYIE